MGYGLIMLTIWGIICVVYLNSPFKHNTKCVICGASFYKRPSHKKRQKDPTLNYCSLRCRGISQQGENNPAWIGGKTEKKCEACGTSFWVEGQRRKTARFCSIRCRGIALSGENSPVYNSRRVPCDYCGKAIELSVCFFNTGQSNYCGKNCQNKAHSERMTGSGNVNWRNGIGKLPYGFEFTQKVKNKVKERDNQTCKNCGNENCVLAVHHIDYDKLNNNENNLIALCEICHGKTGYYRKDWQQGLSLLIKE